MTGDPALNADYVGHRRGDHDPSECEICRSYLRYLGYEIPPPNPSDRLHAPARLFNPDRPS